MSRLEALGRTRLALIALIGVLVLVLIAMAGAAFLKGFNRVGYVSHFVEAGGIKTGDQVRIAGIESGKVTGVAIDGTKVRVDFEVERGLRLGRETKVAVKLASLFGARYLEVRPQGEGELPEGHVFGLDATEPVFTLQEFATQATESLSRLDTERITQLLKTLTTEFQDTPEVTRRVLTNLGRLSETIYSRDKQFQKLLGSTATVSKALADQRGELGELFQEASLILQVVRARREAIHRLLVDVDAMSRQLTSVVQTNNDDLTSALASLKVITDVMRANEKQLDEIYDRFGPASRYITNAAGNGPWLDVFSPHLLVPDNIVCTAQQEEC